MKQKYVPRRGNTGPYPKYKKVIFYLTELDELEAYLQIARDNIAEHAKGDCLRFIENVERQIKKQPFRVKKDL